MVSPGYLNKEIKKIKEAQSNQIAAYYNLTVTEIFGKPLGSDGDSASTVHALQGRQLEKEGP
jgi:hypothetical protein